MSKVTPYDLDALFGRPQPAITVIWRGRTYELRRPASFGPLELLKHQRLNQQVDELLPVEPQTPEEEERLATDLEATLRAQLQMICPEIGALNRDALPYQVVMATLGHYNETLRAEREEAAPSDPKAPTRARRTGAGSLPN